MNDLSLYRKSYEKSELLETHLPDAPMLLFARWFCEVEKVGASTEVNAMTLSTIGLDGFPRARVVLLKKFAQEGFYFYTNYDSAKGKSMTAHPNVCLSFFWPDMERQVIIKGIAQKTSKEVSNGYFDFRPDYSKLAAIISNQSEVIPSRGFLEDKLAKIETECEGKSILRPDYWGGFLVVPLEFEFWQGRPSRLHDRIRYQRDTENAWKIERLSP
jgi:pyridoxamine 5'-phosphate oxidase